MEAEFKKFGSIRDIYIPRKPGGQSKGFGFVRFEKKEDAQDAIEEMDRFEIDGREIQVDFAKYDHFTTV